MRTEEEIREKLKDKEKMATHDYGNIRPLSEYVYHEDVGFYKALEWVLASTEGNNEK